MKSKYCICEIPDFDDKDEEYRYHICRKCNKERGYGRES